jgi:hypothetical protein
MPSERRVRGACLIELFAAAASAHDYHSGNAGSFDASIARLDEARGAEVDTPITRSNYRVLGSMPALLSRYGVASWRIIVQRGADADAPQPGPRLALAIPFALHAIDRAVKLGIDARIIDAPLCLLGPFAERAVTGTPGAFPDRCQGCSVRTRCAGVDEAYAARFGGSELRPQ